MRPYGVIALVFVVGCAAHHSSGCETTPINLDLDGPDECTPAGGSCEGDCPSATHHYSSEACPGFLFRGACCMRGGDGSGTFPTPTSTSTTNPPPFSVGKCNGTACAPGCVCRPTAGQSGTCTGACDCTDGGSPDASVAPDASDDAGDASDPGDASDDASDASDASLPSPGPSVVCGVIECASPCSCLSQSLSTCVCYSNDCH